MIFISQLICNPVHKASKTCLLPSSLLPSKKSNLVTKLPLLPPANEVWGKVIFSVACVKNSVHGGREYLGRYTPRAGTPPKQVQPHPPSGYTPSPRAGTSPPQPPGQVHPPRSSACWEIRATSGRYASYWNAFLFSRYGDIP